MYLCPNDNKHGKLTKSKHTPTSYICNKCQGFACWDINELSSESNEIPYEKIVRMNERLIEEIDRTFGQPLPYSFRIDYFTDKKDSLEIKAIDIVTAQRVQFKDVHSYTMTKVKDIFKRILSEFMD